MKRSCPDSGHENETLGHKLKRAKNISNIQRKVNMNKKIDLDDIRKNKPESKKKSFMSYILSQDKKNNSANKENRSSANVKESQDLTQKLMSIKISQRKKEPSQKTDSPKKDMDAVSSNSLFPANILENSTEIIEDYSIKTKMKIFSTQSMDWVNSVTFNQDDIQVKQELEKTLSYYVYPAQFLKLSSDSLRKSQLSQPVEKLTETEKRDKEWFLAFKDCYLKWLSFDDAKGDRKEFTLLTGTYKVKFVSKGVNKDGEIHRKKFAAVTNPSEALLKKLEEEKVPFETHFERGWMNTQNDDDEFEDKTVYHIENGELKKDELSLFDIKLIGKGEKKTILIEDLCGIHALMNTLLNLCLPYLKEVKLVAAYSFTNSVHRNADIEYNGKVVMKKNLNKAISETSEEPDWYSVELRGIFSYITVKTLVKLLENRVKKSVTPDGKKEIVRIK